MASWVSSMIRSTSSIDSTWHGRRQSNQHRAVKQGPRHSWTSPTSCIFFRHWFPIFSPSMTFFSIWANSRSWTWNTQKREAFTTLLFLHAAHLWNPVMAHHCLQVADLILSLIQKLLLVALLFQQQNCLPVKYIKQSGLNFLFDVKYKEKYCN